MQTISFLGSRFQTINDTPLQSKYETVYHEQPINGSQSEEFDRKQTANIKETIFTPITSRASLRKTAELCLFSDLSDNDELHLESRTAGYCGSSVDLEESNALLEWVAKVTNRLVTDYSE